VYLYSTPEYIEDEVEEPYCLKGVQVLSNLVIIADKYGVCDMVIAVTSTLMGVISNCKATHATETLEILLHVMKVVFGPEACPEFEDDTSLKDTITLLACQQFKIVPDRRKTISQLMDEYVELRERMIRMSLLTEELQNIKAVPRWTDTAR
jgi:hypothetical protein